MYDVLVVGARCAGSLTALLLARGGLRVLLVDRTAVATDTLCTHYLGPAGVATLAAHGLLGRLDATGCPPAQRTLVSTGPVTVELPGLTYAPRRSVLDGLLAEAAAEAGAEVREGFTVSDLVWDGERVSGVVGHGGNGRSVVETADLVVGADGRHSVVADRVGAERYRERAATSCCYYAYWDGVVADGPELHLARGGAVGIFPTNDGLACVVAARPVGDWVAFKRSPEATYLSQLGRFPGVAERVRQASRDSRFFGSADLGGCFRRSSGPGWALVGDAGLHRDPLLGGGMADALAQAVLLARALRNGLGGLVPLEQALAGYHRLRDEAWGPLYEATWALASFAWSPDRLPRLIADLVAASVPTVALAEGPTDDRSSSP